MSVVRGLAVLESACGLLRPFAGSACERRARCGGRCPVWAPAVAVGLAGRLRCAARSEGAPRNSLRSLRSLCSNSLGESDERSALRAPPSALRCSPPHKSPPPGAAHRAAALVVFDDKELGGAGKAGGGCASPATYAARRNAGLLVARATRAFRPLTRRDCPSGANEVSKASFAADQEAEYRKAVGPQGQPPHSSAGAYPPAALLARWRRAATHGPPCAL